MPSPTDSCIRYSEFGEMFPARSPANRGLSELTAICQESWHSLRADDFAYTPPMRQRILIASCVCILVLVAAGSVFAQANPEWTEPFPPFHIAGNLYYVGSKGLANYLVTTPQGNILINSDLEANVPLIDASIGKLGFKLKDTKILLISHAHWDHDAGSAIIKEMTGAAYMVMDADVPVVESGGKTDFQYGNSPTTLYRPTKVDRMLHDGEEVRLGGTVLVAHLTPGHTKGCTTWTMQVTDRGKTYNVVILGSPNVNPGYKLVGNTAYPQIAEDYEHMWRVLKSLPCDIFLGAHGSYFGLDEKYPKMKEERENPFADPSGYKKYIAQKEQDFRAELARQKLAAK
jgi:metallo-beta-lactamase class B